MHGTKASWSQSRSTAILVIFVAPLTGGLAAEAGAEAAGAKDPVPDARFSTPSPGRRAGGSHHLHDRVTPKSDGSRVPSIPDNGAVLSRRRRRTYTSGSPLVLEEEPPAPAEAAGLASESAPADNIEGRARTASTEVLSKQDWSLILLQAQSSVFHAAMRSVNPAFLILGLILAVAATLAALMLCSKPTAGPRQELPSATSAPRKTPVPRFPAPTAEEAAALAVMQAAEASSKHLAMQRLQRGSAHTSSFLDSCRPTLAPSPISQSSRLRSVQSHVLMNSAASLREKVPSSASCQAGTRPGSTRCMEQGRSGVLCPCLVVPEGMEFVFAVRDVLCPTRQQLSFSVVDLEGAPLSYVIVNESAPGSECGVFLQMLNREPLASVRTGMFFEQPSRLPEICTPSGEVFGLLAKDSSGYQLLSSFGQKLLRLQGDFRRKAVSITAASGELVCTTERCTVDFEGGKHYQVRVAPSVDAGLVLCSLLAVDKVEGAIVDR
eukprot:TRINITY_DN14497_c0_g1_i1.p1 TRINITY_DN14497_c0_g1~~TRINITY_DN14497_c0_g1_i1.p1  ORF type:complete len:493 (-),score=96.51 TRINITY_DN14497_c0_g1_i1:257-1735(-)